MRQKSSSEQLQHYLKKIKSIQNKIQNLKRQIPANLGKHLMNATRQPMINKRGKKVMYRTTNGKMKPRHHYIRDWHEFTSKYVIISRKKYNELIKQNEHDFN